MPDNTTAQYRIKKGTFTVLTKENNKLVKKVLNIGDMVSLTNEKAVIYPPDMLEKLNTEGENSENDFVSDISEMKDGSVKRGIRNTQSTSTATTFDPQTVLAGSLKDINKALLTITDSSQLSALYEAEEQGKKRKDVLSALQTRFDEQNKANEVVIP